MAEKRMFSNKVIGSDAFLEMPDSTQNLYFHLSMSADDDGFVDKVKTIMRMTGKKEDDLKILIAKSFVIPFDSGVLVIKDWRINNYLRSDRYNETIYLKEKAQLTLTRNNSYALKDTVGIPVVYTEENRLEENRLDNVEQVDEPTSDTINEIISFLNEKAKSSYRSSTPKTRQLIGARLKEKFVVEDFKKVIEFKCQQWLNDAKMSAYIRPETLFGTKFESYLNEAKRGIGSQVLGSQATHSDEYLEKFRRKRG